MGDIVIDATQHEELELEFQQLLTRVVEGIKSGKIPLRPGFVYTKRKGLLSRRRRVYAKWTSFGLHYFRDEPDDYVICLISDRGETANFIRYTKGGCYVTPYRGVTSASAARNWIEGMKMLLGISEVHPDAAVTYAVNPA